MKQKQEDQERLVCSQADLYTAYRTFFLFGYLDHYDDTYFEENTSKVYRVDHPCAKSLIAGSTATLNNLINSFLSRNCFIPVIGLWQIFSGTLT